MVGTVPIRVASFLLLTACGALGQQPQENAASISLPDAPSVQASVQANLIRATRPGYVVFYKSESVRNESGDFFGKYLYPSLLKRNLNYHPSTSSGLMGRATYAASRILITRDESGKGRLNTSYLLAVLSVAAAHTANVPYWRRSAAAPFSDFGSTLGNDAGLNLLHEFRPGLQQLMKSHAPKFAAKLAERIGHN